MNNVDLHDPTNPAWRLICCFGKILKCVFIIAAAAVIIPFWMIIKLAENYK